MIVVQRLVTEWTKASRGAPGATRRNATPEAAPLAPVLPGRPDGYLEHQVVFDEAHAFAGRENVAWCEELPAEVGRRGRSPVVLELEEGALVVSFRGGTAGEAFGRPANRRCFALALGTQGRVTFNGRFTTCGCCGGAWIYRKTILRIANVPDGEAIPADLFLRPTPHVCSHMGRLR